MGKTHFCALFERPCAHLETSVSSYSFSPIILAPLREAVNLVAQFQLFVLLAII